MSESGDSGPGRREVAHRLFAAEFDDADFSYSESDEERAPNYVVTPTGARVNRLFLVGVLTELEQVNDDVLRARVVDPTGPFVIYAGQYQPDELAFLEAADPPMFVAVTGKARTFQPDDSDRVFTSVRPESISEVDDDTRDRWVVQAAEQTVSRIGQMASAKQAGLTGDELRLALVDRGIDESAAAGITLALDHYGTTGDYLDALRTTALDAARVVAGDTDEAEGLSLSPDDGTDDPIPLLASLDLDTDVSTPETTADGVDADATADEPEMESGADEPETESEASESATETTASEPVAETTESDAATDEPATETASADDTTETTIDEEPAVSETLSATEPETVDTETETSTTVASTSEPEPSSGTDADVSSEAAAESGLDADTTEPETATSTTADSDTAAEGDGDLGEFDPEFDLDEDEREEIEQEYGTDFQTGTEVEEPGEAGIETPDPEAVADAADAGTEVDNEPETEPASATESETEPETAPGTAPSAEEDTASPGAETTAEPAAESDEDDDSGAEPAEDVDLEDAAMEIMDELDDGNGADREELLSTVVDRYGADADAVADAIQDALMGGRCYEPDDGKLKPI
ncbi:hypothetical protein SAMN05443574_10994 [Haloarcula vallismortis]|uniref:Rpa-associated protein n=2 Tax=Haloarcula vallismortis TaxID=28442 RepID=M0JMX9_HALVA|nr:hypothetical protein [Haloarcula vallismortis]EMA10376.1 hypothetical protein C437_03696 [Haloarcula vallismortis ATCC 29715]SDW91428.1 hypothetical protein SAMN05443574_10994 [Haloarcula vallismortis]